jgi:hypothetical protein
VRAALDVPATEPPEELRRALLEEWKGGAEGVLLLADAVRERRIREPT